MIDFAYQPYLRELARKCTREIAGHAGTNRFAHTLAMLQALPEMEKILAENYGRPSLIFYLMMQARASQPKKFPPHVLQLLIASMLAKNLEDPGGTLCVLDWEVLPAAVLLAAHLSGRIEVRLSVPKQDWEHRESAYLLLKELGKLLPEIGWKLDQVDLGFESSLVLGNDFLAHCKKDKSFLDKLTVAKGGIFVCAWDFLGGMNYGDLREKCMNRKLIEKIIQLPKPNREGYGLHPALLLLKKDSWIIRLALKETNDSVSGGLNLKDCMSLLFDPPVTGKSMDQECVDFCEDFLLNLTPSLWLQAHLQKDTYTTLRRYAHVLRCQIPRKRQTPGDPEQSGVTLGTKTASGLLAKELTLGDCDPVSGFLEPQAGNIVIFEMDNSSRYQKYLLRKNDILMAFRGSVASIGRVGFVEDMTDPAITGLSVCIVRAYPDVNPVWLYYYLKREETRAYISGIASGSSILTINIDSIRDIPIILPTKTECQEIEEAHGNIAEAMTKIRELQASIPQELRRIEDVLNGERNT